EKGSLNVGWKTDGPGAHRPQGMRGEEVKPEAGRQLLGHEHDKYRQRQEENCRIEYTAGHPVRSKGCPVPSDRLMTGRARSYLGPLDPRKRDDGQRPAMRTAIFDVHRHAFPESYFLDWGRQTC